MPTTIKRPKRVPQFKSYEQIPDMPYGELTVEQIDDLQFKRKKGAIIAKRALLAGYQGENAPEDTVVDLLADLRHFCDAIGADFADLDAQAYEHYTEEIFGRP